jgi:hypothetical protein
MDILRLVVCMPTEVFIPICNDSAVVCMKSKSKESFCMTVDLFTLQITLHRKKINNCQDVLLKYMFITFVLDINQIRPLVQHTDIIQ